MLSSDTLQKERLLKIVLNKFHITHCFMVHPPNEKFKALLNQEGFRFTHQRQKILALLKHPTHPHLSAEEIHAQLTQAGETISLSTIYRSLHVMVRLGLLRELELTKDKKFYELNAPFHRQHHHLVCIHCGTVLEFEEDRVVQVSTDQTGSRGYALLDCQFTIYGICSQCQQLNLW